MYHHEWQCHSIFVVAVSKVRVIVRVHIIRIQLLSICTDLLTLLQPNIVLWYIIIIVAVFSPMFFCATDLFATKLGVWMYCY